MTPRNILSPQSRALRKRSFCPLSRRSLGRIEAPLPFRSRNRENHTARRRSNRKETARKHPAPRENRYLPITGNVARSVGYGYFTGDGISMPISAANG